MFGSPLGEPLLPPSLPSGGTTWCRRPHFCRRILSLHFTASPVIRVSQSNGGLGRAGLGDSGTRGPSPRPAKGGRRFSLYHELHRPTPVIPAAHEFSPRFAPTALLYPPRRPAWRGLYLPRETVAERTCPGPRASGRGIRVGAAARWPRAGAGQQARRGPSRRRGSQGAARSPRSSPRARSSADARARAQRPRLLLPPLARSPQARGRVQVQPRLAHPI